MDGDRRSRTLDTLLAGMESGVAVLKNGLTTPQKVKYRDTM